MPVYVGACGALGRSALGQVPCAGRVWGEGASGHTMGRCLAQLLHAPLVLGGLGGGDLRQGHTFVVLQRAVVGACGGLNCVCPVRRAPVAGHGCPTTWLLREFVVRVTGSFLHPMTEPQRGARGV